MYAFNIESHGLLQVVFDQPKHLVRFMDFHEPFLEAEVFAERRHAAYMDTGHSRTAKIHRHAVGLAVRKSREYSFPAGHLVLLQNSPATIVTVEA